MPARRNEPADLKRRMAELEESRIQLRRTDERLSERLAFESLILSLSTRFINVFPDEVDGAINDALRGIGEFVGADRSYAFLFHDDNRLLSNTHEWCASGIEPMIDRLQSLSMEEFSWSTEKILEQKVVHIPSVEDLPVEAALLKEELEAQSIQSLILVPAVASGRVVGFLGFDAVREKKTWTDNTISLLYIVGEIFSNAVERRETVRKLLIEQSRSQKYLDVAGVMFVALDREGVVTLVNKKGCEILGRDSNEIVGRSWFDHFLPEKIRGRVRDVYDHIRRDHREPVELCENTVLTASGEERLIAWHNTILTDDRGNFAGTLSSGEDITKRKEIETALRESEEHLRSLMESARDFVVYRIAIDRSEPANGRVVFVSPSIREIFGVRNPERFEEWFENIHEEDLPRIAESNRLAVEETQPFREVMRIHHPVRKEVRWIQVVSNPVFDDAGRVTHFNGMALDITDRKRVEEELMRANEELKKVDQMKDSFLSSVSHELRTPLTSIRSFSEYLMNYDEDPETQKEFAEIINCESERLTRLINDVLDLSKIEAGGMTWNNEICSVEEIARGALKAQTQVLEEKSIRLRVDFDPGLPPTCLDKDRIHQVLINLIGNAIKFSPARSEIEVRGRIVDGKRTCDPGDWIEISVSDGGIGISPENFEKIFEKFQQASAPTSPDTPKGTGLGLPICREIVTHYGGNVWVESRKGGGSVFRFTLPVLAEPEQAPEESVGKKDGKLPREPSAPANVPNPATDLSSP